MSGLLNMLQPQKPAAPPPPPNPYLQALQNAWGKYGAQMPQPIPNAQMPPSFNMGGNAPAMRPGQLPPGVQPIPNAKPPPGFNLNPSSIRVDFHAPEANQ